MALKIHEQIRDLPIPAKDRATFKGSEISKLVICVARQNVKFAGSDYDIEIVETRPIKNGVEVFARAWDSNGQIGFGDGSVDLERFVFINPPVLVSDPTGDIIRKWTDSKTGELKQRILREDPKLAILQSLAHTISLIEKNKPRGRIISGKVGNTTLTAYPNAGTGTAPIDGSMDRHAVNEIYTTINNGAGTAHDDTVAAQGAPGLYATTTPNQFSRQRRAGYGFNTSSIGTNGIDSATLSLVVATKVTALGDTDIDITSFTPASQSDFVNGDYDVANFGSTRLATGKAISTITADDATYNTWTLNADGKTAINKTGNTFFGVRLKWDVDNSFTGTWSSEGSTDNVTRFADQAGTTQDPKLVVEHSNNLNISVIDTITVTENINQNEISFINVNDTITIAESVSFESIFGLNVSDSITIAESITMHVQSFINVNDTVTIDDVATILIPLLLIDLNDSITITENFNPDLTSFINVSDSVTIAENLAIQSIVGIIVNDSVSVAENITFHVQSFIDVNDAITVAENFNSDVFSFINVNDSITVTESSTVILPFLAVSVSDSISVSEAVVLLTQVLWTKRTAISTTFSNRDAVSTTFSDRTAVTTPWVPRDNQPGGGDP